jgi:hypothetical protein
MTFRLLTIIICGVVIQGCSGLQNIPLVWKPTSDIYDSNAGTVTTFFDQKFRVMPFSDGRDNKSEIAKNVEGSSPKLVTTKDDVAVWCTDRFKEILRQHGLTLVDSNETVVLKGEVLQFYVLEDTRYKGMVGIKLTAESLAGVNLWQGVLTGTAKRFGRSYSQDNYYETLSDSFLNAIQSLMKNEDFKNALMRKTL